MNQQIIITRGLSGSGKTTWSKEFVNIHADYVRVARDELNFMLSEGEYTRRLEKTVFLARDVLIELVLDEGYNLVLDETFLVPKRVARIKEILATYARGMRKHLHIVVHDFIDTPLEQCIERDKNRHFSVGEAFIREYHEKYIIPLLKDRGETEWTI